ncbi:peptide/nickel transport system ATP-binding protein [Actinocorallia herbida]|uniref:Peptide/nickel transport system ATP-binding protein n=1 Tax=Actinocorallia herbida TaxID=58109 RepID=A0A3N1CWC9_9ACTN|nr:ABC transporter ATP-binding protein [Actinocorallia herbida]ROO85596.1 peptide/nickel transport system ATP-binding protein [Actinocorallia herbida]
MTEPLLDVRDLTVRFPGPVEAVRGVSFTVGRGRIVAMVGESGSGKSVTARSLVGLAGDRAEVNAAALSFAGRDLRGLDARGWRAVRGRRIGFVLQDALGSLDPLRRVGAEIAEPLREHRTVPPAGIPAEVARLLKAVGVPSPGTRARQYPHELSGGLRQRALLASALAARPDLLIADEPTTALDATVRRQVLTLLRALADTGTAVLLITHDLGVVAEIADHVHVMREGGFVENGPARRVLDEPAHAYTRSLVGAASGPRAEPAIGPARTVLRGENLVKRFPVPGRGVLTAVSGVSLDVREGRVLGLVGESGSGKTTVGRILAGLARPDSGAVRLDGRPWEALRGRARRAARRRVQMVYQYPLGSFDPRRTAGRLLVEPLRAGGVPADERPDRCAALLDGVGLPADVLGRKGSELSGGQAQRLAIARALACDPDVIVCDEPVSALDASVQARVLDVFAEIRARRSVAFVLISHDLGVVRRLADDVAVMKDGAVVESGPADRVLDEPAHPYTRELLAAVPRLDRSG